MRIITFDPTADHGKGVWRVLETSISRLAFLEEKEIYDLSSILLFKNGSAILKEQRVVVFIENKIAICNIIFPKRKWKDFKFESISEKEKWITNFMWKEQITLSDRVYLVTFS